ncbi:MAG TPA: PIN domain-containing protein [Acetobacteraceae bacterium]|jgi:predicted nucleic acid-binding protein
MGTVVFDSTFLLLLTDNLAHAPSPPAGVLFPGNSSVADVALDRLNFLLETLDNARTDVVVPTPVLTELLASARADVSGTLAVLNGLARIRIEGFGQRAAIECADMLRRTGRGTGPKAKVKFDHQIVAIAKVVGAAAVYSDDRDVHRLCELEGLPCKGVWDLPPRPVDPQSSLPLDGSE